MSEEAGSDRIKAAIVHVHKAYKEGKILKREESLAEPIEVLNYPELPKGTVGFGLKSTRNLGNFESVSVSVYCELPCIPAEAEDAYKAAKEFVDLRMQKEMTDISDFTKSK